MISKEVTTIKKNDMLILMSLVVVVGNVPLEFVDQQRRAFGAASLVADGVFDFNFINNGSVVQLNKEGVADGSLGRVVVLDAETILLDTVNLRTEGINSWVRSSGISAEGILSMNVILKTWLTGLTSFQRSIRRRSRDMQPCS